MSLEALLFQALNGLATASGLFFVGAGLSLIFGVTRIINIAHGSLYMLGLYLAYTFATRLGGVLGFWGGIVAAGTGGCGTRRADRDRAAAPNLPGARTVPAARDLRAGARHQRRGAVPLGPGRPARAARAGIARLGRDPRPQLPELRPVPDRRRPCRPSAAPSDAGQDALRPADPRRDAGPRDGRRARRQPGAAVHGRVHAGRLPRRHRRRASGGARAGQSLARPDRDRRRFRRRRGRRHGLHSRRLPGRDHHRRGQGAVHRLRRGAYRRLHRQLLEADAGRRISGHGDRADRAAIRSARPAAGRRARSGRGRRPDPARDLVPQAARSRGAARTARGAAWPTRPRLTRWCSASTC